MDYNSLGALGARLVVGGPLGRFFTLRASLILSGRALMQVLVMSGSQKYFGEIQLAVFEKCTQQAEKQSVDTGHGRQTSVF